MDTCWYCRKVFFHPENVEYHKLTLAHEQNVQYAEQTVLAEIDSHFNYLNERRHKKAAVSPQSPNTREESPLVVNVTLNNAETDGEATTAKENDDEENCPVVEMEDLS